MARVKEPPIILTNEWGALPPKEPVTLCGRPTETIYHHTAGHHPEISNPRNESFLEARAFARNIQRFHMFSRERQWNDSGHNFLACRNGMLFVGRHKSYTQVRQGLMVVSAHCPGHNRSPGIEIEHDGQERMTDIQFEMVSWLYAWIHDRCGIPGVVIYPHKKFFATSCPGALLSELSDVKARVREIRQRGEL